MEGLGVEPRSSKNQFDVLPTKAFAEQNVWELNPIRERRPSYHYGVLPDYWGFAPLSFVLQAINPFEHRTHSVI